MILLHGFAQTSQSWQTTIENLSDDREVHAIELPGHGKTGLTLGEPGVELVREFIASEIARIADGRAIVWGYSQGGRVAYDLVLNSLQSVSALIIESAAPGIEDPINRADRRSRDFALASRIEAGPIEDFVGLWERIPALGEQSKQTIEQQRPDRLAQDPVALAAALRGIGQAAYEPMWDRLGEIQIPVLLLAGERDAIYSAHSKRAATLIPNASFKQVEGASHAVHLAQPEAAAQLVEDFLS